MVATLTNLVSFLGAASSVPLGDLIADPGGDLLGTGDSGAFEIAKTSTGFDPTPITLVTFDGPDGKFANAGLAADSHGDLFGTTSYGGAYGDGTVFEIVKTATGYANTPTILVSFDGANGLNPFASVIADSNGDLFGTTYEGGAGNAGTVFEIKKTSTGYASAPTTLVSFNGFIGSAGDFPNGSLLADANGDLFGPTSGGAFGGGTVFEIIKTATGYSTPMALARFNGANGSGPSRLTADANGDLFGTTNTGGDNNGGTAFEIKKTAAGYAIAPTTLVNFADGDSPAGGLIADANGDLFGTTFRGGDDGAGTVFEIAKTSTGYASAPTTLISFDGLNNKGPTGSLIADAHGDLFGTTTTGFEIGGAAFEITGSGFVPGAPRAAPAKDDSILLWNTDGQAALWGMDGTNVVAGGTVSPNPGPSWFAAGTGDFNGDGHPDILWQNADGQAAVWDMDGTTLIGGGAVSPNPGRSWFAAGTGDFNGDGHSDILWRNADGQAAVWDMNGNALIGGGAVSPNPGPSWFAAGTGDFNGDGHSDILWQNADGQAAVWEMNGNKVIGGGTVSPNPGPSWSVVGSGDFNGDGRSDILWQNANGQVAVWEMNGNALIGGGTVATNPGASWFAVGAGDFNGDGHSDILFQSTNWQIAAWDMSGTNIVGGGAVSANPGLNWYAIGLV